MLSRAAVIDIGTNSVKLLVAERDEKKFKVLAERTAVVRLGDGLSLSGTISVPGAGRTLSVLSRFAEEANALGADEIRVIATEAMRAAVNADWFAGLAEQAVGVPVDVIDGKEEARLSFCAVSGYVREGEPLLVFDAGGGSTELVYGAAGSVLMRISAAVGALTFFDRSRDDAGMVTLESLYSMRPFVQAVFKGAGFEEIKRAASSAACRIVGVGGTAATLGAVSLALAQYDRAKLEGLVLSAKEIERQLLLYDQTTLEERKKIAGLPEDRAEIAPVGALLVHEVLAMFGRDSFVVSTRGLRYGAMAELLRL